MHPVVLYASYDRGVSLPKALGQALRALSRTLGPDGEKPGRDVLPGQAAPANGGQALDYLSRIPDALLPASGPFLKSIDGGGDHLPDGDLLQRLALQVVEKGRGEGCKAQLVYAHSPGQGMSCQARHKLPLSRHDAGLGASQELVAREEDQVCPGRDTVLHHRLAGQPEPGGIHKAATALVVEDGSPAAGAKRRQVFHVGFMGKADDSEVAGMHLEHCGCILGYGAFVVGEVGAVGRAHIHQRRAALPQHVGYAESAAYLHGLTPGYNDLFAVGNCRKAQQHGRGVVVDHQGRLCAGYLAQQGLDVTLAGSPCSVAQVQFQVGVPSRGLEHSLHGLVA